MPVLTRRSDLPDGQWPPPLGATHPNGAARLAELRVRVGDPAPLVRLFETLQLPLAAPDTFELGGTRIVVRIVNNGPIGVCAVVLEGANGGYLEFGTEPLGPQINAGSK